MQSEELKPCPFCGGNNLSFRLSDIEGWIAHVECTDCDDMLGPMSEWKHDEKEDAEKDAAAVWNKRAALEAALSAQVQDVAGSVPEEVREAATEVITAHECGMLRQTTWWENAAFLLAEYAMSSGDYAAAPAKQEG